MFSSDIEVDSTGAAFVVDSTTRAGKVPVKPLSLERLMRIAPDAVVYNLINRADAAQLAGNVSEAQALMAEAEKWFCRATGFKP